MRTREPLVAVKGSFTVLAPGTNFVLSLVLCLAEGLQLHKQHFVRLDDMHASKLSLHAVQPPADAFFRAHGPYFLLSVTIYLVWPLDANGHLTIVI